MSYKKSKIPIGVQQDFDDVDYWHKLPKDQTVKLKNGKEITIYEYMKKFMQESYGNGFSRQDPDSNILQTEEQKTWARRNNNVLNRDTLRKMLKAPNLVGTLETHRPLAEVDGEHWYEIYKAIGVEPAAWEMMQQCCDDLEIEMTEHDISVILKVYFRIREFGRVVRLDIRNKKIKVDE